GVHVSVSKTFEELLGDLVLDEDTRGPVRALSAGIEGHERNELELLLATTRDVADFGDPPAPVSLTTELDDDVDSRVCLRAQGVEGNVHLAHRGKRLEPGESVVRRVRVHRGQGPVVSGVHRLEHVE